MESVPPSEQEIVDRLLKYRYLFLFQKNLSVTNIQYGELFSLIFQSVPSVLTAMESTELDEMLRAARDDTTHGVASPTGLERHLSRLGINSTVVFRPYFTCCVVLSPVELPLSEIVGRSGYIHSAGPLVFEGEFDRVAHPAFLEALRSYITSDQREQASPALVQFYTRETYPPLDWKAEDELGGLEEIKLPLDKAFFGFRTLQSEITELSSQLEGVATLDPDYYATISQAEELGNYVERPSTIFIIVDHEIDRRSAGADDFGPIHRDERRSLLIAYDSKVRRNNRVHVFDEAKPHWTGSYTTPQRLMAAMVNLGHTMRGGLIVDPFAGTGTMALEARKYPLRILGSDLLEPASAWDNIRLFDLSSAELELLSGRVDHLLRTDEPRALLEDLAKMSVARQEAPFYRVTVDFDAIWTAWEPEDAGARGVASQMTAMLQEQSIIDFSQLADRIAFYLTRRVVMSGPRTAVRIPVPTDRSQDFRFWSDRIKELIRVTKREEQSGIEGEIAGHFARHASYRPHVDAEMEGLRRADGSEMDYLADGSVDLIVTDPPYGFNTEDDREALLDMYLRFLEAAVRCLRPDGGELIMCLPEGTQTGKYIPSFIRHENVSRLVAQIARARGLRVAESPGRSPTNWFTWDPFYWNAQRGVSRTIARFRLYRPWWGNVPQL